ncbi:LysR family transcriptional regulator [Pandoraea terrae]|uniref:LysR family transcriptional regulator n=1 Tax=Pandoraea terrae TaxID=1537710 RepID=A0A5E4SBM0_9BURK|nr:LysR family transcriptional regulator [Pandoraea terrae]VVD71419.1 LysR family transcriptional regulator [Pandoraea terrae]
MQIRDVDLKLLRVFETIVRCGGFTAAQNVLGVGASSISEQMTQLEARFGVRLCERGRGGFRLTDEGLQMHEAAQRLLASVDTFNMEASAIRRELHGVLRLGMIEATLTDPQAPLLAAIRQFGQAAPKVQLHIEIDSPDRLEQRVLDGSLHLAVGPFPDPAPGLDSRVLYQEEQGLYCASPHPLFYGANADAPELADQIATAKLATRGYLGRKELELLGMREPAALVDNVEGRAMLILSGNYIGFLPPHYADAWVERGLLRRLVPQCYTTHLDFKIVTRRTVSTPRVVRTLIGFLAEARHG